MLKTKNVKKTKMCASNIFWSFFSRSFDGKSCKNSKKVISVCFLFRPAFGCCALQTLVEVLILNVFCAEKLKKCKKVRNLQQNSVKNGVLKFAPKSWSSVAYFRDIVFSKTSYAFKLKKQRSIHSRLLRSFTAMCTHSFWRIFQISLTKTVLFSGCWVVYMVFFCGIDSTWDAPTWRHYACVLKSKDVGYCGKVNGERESGLCVQRAGGWIENNCRTMT